ncbi:MAG TPA: type II secretion system minor pseudopilin GspH [Steroidobacteraceae bacterium]|nr:type II secretion system minor pseudopilin GspH [Steroidobacteraceae bacterium]
METGPVGRAAPPRLASGATSPAAGRGFTLIELLVVCVIIGIIVAGAVLSISVLGKDNGLETERDRLVALMNYARDQASLQTRELGLYCTQDGYRFLAFNPRTNLWTDIKDDDALRARALPEGLTIRLAVESHEIVLTTADKADKLPKTDPQSYKPHIMIFSNGDLTSFELTLERAGTDHSATLEPDGEGHIVVHASSESESAESPS